MSGNLYQLAVSYTSPKPGDVVKIDGQWDTYARILRLKENGFHLMRGMGHATPTTNVRGSASEQP